MRRLVTALAIACTAAAGCGGGDDADDGGGRAEDQAGKAARDYLMALAAGNDQRACDMLSEQGREQAVSDVEAALGTGELSCREAIQELSTDIAQEDKRVFLNPDVRRVTVSGDRATVEMVHVAQPVPLRRVDDRWRVERSRFDLER